MKGKYLPIGTVCRLKEGQKNLMIIGFCQSSAENPNVIYDYNACMYPEGVLSSEINFLFNHEQIDEIVYEGLVTEEELNFKIKLNEFIQKGTIDGKQVNLDLNGNITLTDVEINQNSNIEIQESTNNQNLQQPQPDQSLETVHPVQPVQPTGTPIFDTLNFNQQNGNN